MELRSEIDLLIQIFLYSWRRFANTSDLDLFTYPEKNSDVKSSISRAQYYAYVFLDPRLLVDIFLLVCTHQDYNFGKFAIDVPESSRYTQYL